MVFSISYEDRETWFEYKNKVMRIWWCVIKTFPCAYSVLYCLGCDCFVMTVRWSCCHSGWQWSFVRAANEETDTGKWGSVHLIVTTFVDDLAVKGLFCIHYLKVIWERFQWTRADFAYVTSSQPTRTSARSSLRKWIVDETFQNNVTEPRNVIK